MSIFRKHNLEPQPASDLCPVCGKYVFKHKYDICPICDWEHDPVQEADPGFSGGANKMCLRDAIIIYGRSHK